MMRAMGWWFVMAALVLTGCAQPVKRQAYNAEAHQGIREVVVAQLPNQDSYEAVVIGHPGMSFGLIGGLIAAADTQSKSARLTAAVDAAQTKLCDHFTGLLRDGLTEQGYSVQTVVLPEGTDPDQVAALVKKDTAADAVLVTRIVGAYWAAGPMTDYWPRIQAELRAVNLASGATVYEDTFTYGYSSGNEGTVHFPADEKYRFKDIDALTSNPALAREGWIAGLKQISAQVLKDVKRQ